MNYLFILAEFVPNNGVLGVVEHFGEIGITFAMDFALQFFQVVVYDFGLPSLREKFIFVKVTIIIALRLWERNPQIYFHSLFTYQTRIQKFFLKHLLGPFSLLAENLHSPRFMSFHGADFFVWQRVN